MEKRIHGIWKGAVLFYLGGMIYISLELLWRGWSHGAMFPVGGLCFLLIDRIDSVFPGLPRLPRAVLGAGLVTVVEFLSGVYLNLYLGLGIWDYSAMDCNILGQVCPAFFFLWCLVAGGATFLDTGVRKLLFQEAPHSIPLI